MGAEEMFEIVVRPFLFPFPEETLEMLVWRLRGHLLVLIVLMD